MKSHPWNVCNLTIILGQLLTQNLANWAKGKKEYQSEVAMTTLFYRAFIESILSFSLVLWFGKLSLKTRKSLNQINIYLNGLIG